MPGERCPARRSNKAFDPAVRDVERDRYESRGIRDCGRCGRADVVVKQNGGWDPHNLRFSAWHYDAHTVPDPSTA